MFGEFPYKALLITPFAMTTAVGVSAYTAARLVAEGGAEPNTVGIAAGAAAVTIVGTALCHTALEVIRQIAVEQARASVQIAMPVQPPREYHELRADAFSEPVVLTRDGALGGQLIRFDPEHTNPDWLVKMALYVAAGDYRLNVNLWTTRADGRLTWPRTDYPFFLSELEEYGLAVCNDDNHYELTRQGKEYMRVIAKRSGKPLPHWNRMSGGGKNGAHTRIHGAQGAILG